MAKKQQILIYRLGSLGDTVMALPCFHLIKDTYSNAEITLLTNKPVVSKAAPLESVLGSGGYFFKNVISYPVGTRNPLSLLYIIWQIRKLKIDTVINLTAARSSKSAKRDRIFFNIAGVKSYIGFPKKPEDFKISIDPGNNLYEWEAKRLAKRISDLGEIDFKSDHFWDLKLTLDEKRNASEILNFFSPNSRFITVCAGTKMQSKDWGRENWLALIKRLAIKLPGWKLVMIGAPDESQLADECLNAWSGVGLNLCGKTSPRVSAEVLRYSKLFIGHDSGPMHLAGCVKTPCVAVFAAINRPMQWFPRGDNNRIIYHETDCAGCKLEVCLEQKKKCILSITVTEVESAVLDVLQISNNSLK